MRATATLLLAPLLVMGCTVHRQAGTGDVAFRLIWEGTSDLDLLVEDAGGECIFFGQRESATGGLLDVDCNAGTERMCEHPVENVFWPTATAPSGPYRVWVYAHALLPAEAPLVYELQVLRGTRLAWSRQEAMTRHQELDGPFLYTFPGNEVTVSSVSEPPECGPHWMRRPESPTLP